jgi:hypothetical protein
VERVNGRSLSSQEPDLIIFSDASLSGWVTFRIDVTAKGRERSGSRSPNQRVEAHQALRLTLRFVW